MYVGQELSDVAPDETVDFWFDYYRDLLPSEILQSAIFTLEVVQTATGATVDTNPNSHKSGAAAIQKSFVNVTLDQRPVQRVVGCIDGNKYRVICKATTSFGQQLELFSRFWCRAPN